MERLRNLIGQERPLAEVSQTLCFAVKSLGPAATGAMHVTCSDESEHECLEAFQHGFVQHLLPSLKFARQSAFRIANLGGRYEWGAVRLAEDHFAGSKTRPGFKLLVAKINAHVAYEPLDRPSGSPTSDSSFRLGVWVRYGRDSTCCGALAGLLQDGHQPHTMQLRELFGSEGRDRLSTLADESRVDPLYRPLYIAMVSARLQARQVVLDIQDYTPVTPTYFLVLACVTINRHERDTEIACGIYTLDGREGGGHHAVYFGLGDDPGDYRIDREHGRFIVTDEHLGTERAARNHRELAHSTLKLHGRAAELPIHDERLDRVRQDVARNKHRHHHHARTLLRIALPILAEVAPIPAAVLAFSDGAAGIHHAWRVHKLARELDGDAEARQILEELEQRIDQLDGERAEALLELLMRDYRS